MRTLGRSGLEDIKPGSFDVRRDARFGRRQVCMPEVSGKPVGVQCTGPVSPVPHQIAPTPLIASIREARRFKGCFNGVFNGV